MTIRTTSIGMSQELHRRGRRRSRAIVTLGLTLTLVGCGARTRERVEGETHWLSSCSEGETCSDGLVCICRVCTAACSEAEQCGALGAGGGWGWCVGRPGGGGGGGGGGTRGGGQGRGE